MGMGLRLAAFGLRPIKQLKITKGKNDSKVRKDANNKVFVKRLLSDSLFCCCEAIFPCLNIVQMSTLQPHMMNMRIKMYGVHTYTACLYETKKYDVPHRAVIRRVSTHTVKIIILYSRIDNVRCFNGQ